MSESKTTLITQVFSEQLTQQGLEDLRAKYPVNLIMDMTNDENFSAGRKIQTEKNKLVEKISSRRKDFAAEVKKHGDDLESQVIDIFDVVLIPWKAEEVKRKAIAKEKKERLDALLKAQRLDIQAIRGWVATCLNNSAGYIADTIDAVSDVECSIYHKDLIHEAMQAKDETLKTLGDMLIQQTESERLEAENKAAEAAKLEAEALARQVKKDAEDAAAEIAAAQAITDRIAKLSMMPMSFFGKPSAEIEAKITSLKGYELTFSDFGGQLEAAQTAVSTVLVQLEGMCAQQKIVETAAAEAEARNAIEAPQPVMAEGEPIPTPTPQQDTVQTVVGDAVITEQAIHVNTTEPSANFAFDEGRSQTMRNAEVKQFVDMSYQANLSTRDHIEQAEWFFGDEEMCIMKGGNDDELEYDLEVIVRRVSLKY